MGDETVTLTIDETEITVPKGTTIMQAADRLGIHVPRLCYHPELSISGACRVCIVDVKDMGHYMASCSVPVWDGMQVQTNSPEIRRARRDIIELILDNHPADCQTCERCGRCELQNLAYSMGVRRRHFEGERKHFPIEVSGRSVVRDSEKCILCGRCVRVCAEIQGVYNLSQQYRGFNTVVAPAHMAKMDGSVCIQCGQCIAVCPTAAFLEKRCTREVWDALSDPDMHVVVQTAPAIRAAIGEGFDMEPGTPATGKMVAAFRRLGFDAVFDTVVGADLTIVEEAHELIRRMEGDGPLPMLTSCSPGWINFLEKFYPDLIPHASSCRSPMTMLSVLTKTYYAEQKGIDPDRIFMTAVMPCVAKKYEAGRRDHHQPSGAPYTNAVLTTREAIWMIKSFGMRFVDLPNEEFDPPLGVATGAGDIFGATGGVMEAALRTACELMTGRRSRNLEFKEVRAVEGLREASINIDGKTLNVAVANGLTNAKTILNKIIEGKKQYHLVEIMACPGGCIGGGGQPYPQHGFRVLDSDLLSLRARALYSIDDAKMIRRSHENPAIQKLYKEYLGEPGGAKAEELLHTSYSAKLPRGVR